MPRATWANFPSGRGLIRRKRFATLAISGFLTVMLAWSVVTFARYVPSRVYMVPSNSMAPTIRAGDRVGVQARSVRRPNRGEIWVFFQPKSGSTKSSVTIIKRVIGLPGESVEVADGHVLIDGKVIQEPYLSAPITYAMPRATLGADEFFMLGDSRDSSHDSHVWGPVPRDHLIGPATARLWPLKRAGGL